MPKEAGFPVNQEERSYILQVSGSGVTSRGFDDPFFFYALDSCAASGRLCAVVRLLTWLDGSTLIS